MNVRTHKYFHKAAVQQTLKCLLLKVNVDTFLLFSIFMSGYISRKLLDIVCVIGDDRGRCACAWNVTRILTVLLYCFQGGLDFTLGDGEFDKIGLIAGGIGISPMVQIIREVRRHDACQQISHRCIFEYLFVMSFVESIL